MIRKAEIRDLEQITNLETKNFDDPYPLKFWEKCIGSSNYLCLVFEDEMKVTGYLLAQHTDIYDLLRICVDRTSRKKGIGRQLVSQLNGKPVCLEVRSNNLDAIVFYKKCGFQTASVRSDYYGKGKDALVCIRPKI